MRDERSRLLTPLTAIADYKNGGSATGVRPNKPFIASLVQASSVSSTWYTLFDVTGAGIWNYLTMGVNSLSINNASLEIRITVDSETAYTQTIAATKDGFGFVYSYQSGTYVRGNASRKFFPRLEFVESLKVEVRQTSGSTPTLYGFATYGMVV